MNTTQRLSDSIKKELDVDSFLETLSIESAIDHAKQFAISGWFLLKVLGAIIFLLATQIYKVGQQVRVYFQPSLNKVYNYCKTINHPIAQLITRCLTPQTTPLTDSNGNPLTIRIQTDSVRIQTDSVFTNQTYESMDSQKQPSTHTIS